MATRPVYILPIRLHLEASNEHAAVALLHDSFGVEGGGPVDVTIDGRTMQFLHANLPDPEEAAYGYDFADLTPPDPDGDAARISLLQVVSDLEEAD